MPKIAAKGVVAKYAATATPTTNIDYLKELSLNIGEREMINTTSHDSSGVKDYLPSPLRDSNEVEGTIFYDPANTIHELMRSHHAAGTKGFLTVVLPDTGNAQWAMEGHITAFSIPTLNPETGALEVTFRFKAIAAETFTA